MISRRQRRPGGSTRSWDTGSSWKITLAPRKCFGMAHLVQTWASVLFSCFRRVEVPLFCETHTSLGLSADGPGSLELKKRITCNITLSDHRVQPSQAYDTRTSLLAGFSKLRSHNCAVGRDTVKMSFEDKVSPLRLIVDSVVWKNRDYNQERGDDFAGRACEVHQVPESHLEFSQEVVLSLSGGGGGIRCGGTGWLGKLRGQLAGSDFFEIFHMYKITRRRQLQRVARRGSSMQMLSIRAGNLGHDGRWTCC